MRPPIRPATSSSSSGSILIRSILLDGWTSRRNPWSFLRPIPMGDTFSCRCSICGPTCSLSRLENHWHAGSELSDRSAGLATRSARPCHRGFHKDIQRIDAPTPYVVIIGRTKTDGPPDYDAVHKIQAGYKITPLSQWGKPPQPVTVKVDPTIDM